MNKRLTQADIDGRLLQGNFKRSTEVATLSDPIADTPMVVTLDQLRPYELNPRLTRNPEYDSIKDSMRVRGLDHPPPITRRPGETHYIIRNGGNTRLAILNELWQETHDERFFRIPCLFRPWAGEISALSGHLAENDLHGRLAFIERALGLAKLKELFEQEDGATLSQRELARRLKAAGYPVSQPHISRMFDALEFLLPAIPQVLYAGLGKPKIEKLIGLRKGAEQAWSKYAADQQSFAELWFEVLADFDALPDEFQVDRVQDELLGRMSQALNQSYKILALDLADAENGSRTIDLPPLNLPSQPLETRGITGPATPRPVIPAPQPREEQEPLQPVQLPFSNDTNEPLPSATRLPPAETQAPSPLTLREEERQDRIAGHIVAPVSTTPRVRQIKEQIAREQFGETLPNFEECAVMAIPVQAGGLAQVSDVWYIEKQIDTPEQLRHQIANLAIELAQYAGNRDGIAKTEDGLGFAIRSGHLNAGSPRAAAINLLLTAILRAQDKVDLEDQQLLPGALFGQILMGVYDIPIHDREIEDIGLERLPDVLLIKLFRLIRLARRLVDLTLADHLEQG